MKKIIWAVIIIVLIAIGAYWYVMRIPGGNSDVMTGAVSSVSDAVDKSNPFDVKVNPYDGYKNPFEQGN